MVNGATMTRLPRDLWDKWLEQNKDSDIVRRGLIYALDGDGIQVDTVKLQ